MLDLVHAAVTHIGIAGLAGLWLLKTGVVALGYRWYRGRGRG
ncbi:hypothetical protein [Seohaeicola zhoushanensis]|nr:hypothetical protein [Seohaeicola zhoushanensis]